MTRPGEPPPQVVDAQTRWARLLVRRFADAGITEAVISPGSRSTPLVLAAHHEPRLRCWDVMDERSAGFFALGLGSLRQQPALLLCTSGTAGAHYLPAVIEAAMAYTPLVIVTADRPVDLVDCGANQTIDQARMFGHHARAFVDAGAAASRPRALRALGRQAAQAVHRSRAPLPGAVHVNVRLSKPLEPTTAPERPGLNEPVPKRALVGSSDQDRLPTGQPPSSARTFVAPTSPSDEAVDALADALAAAQRPLFLAGPGPVTQAPAYLTLAALTRRLRAPLLAETTSQLRRYKANEGAITASADAITIAGFDTLLRAASWREAMAPDLIVQLGRAPVAGTWTRWLAALAETETPPAHWVVAPYGWHDPESTATALIHADVGATVDRLHSRLATCDPRIENGWLAAWRSADEQVWAAVNRAVEGTALTEGRVAAAVVARLEPGSLLAVGNSLPVRQIDTWSRGVGLDVLVWHQRGASGIDGLISGATGAAVASQRPTTLLLGDVSFLHDLGGLAVARGMGVPLTIVVVDNGGGRIFEQLPVARHPDAEGALHHWTTPHDADLASAAAIFGHGFVTCSTVLELTAALANSHTRPGCTIVRAVVPPHDAARENHALWQAVTASLGSAP